MKTQRALIKPRALYNHLVVLQILALLAFHIRTGILVGCVHTLFCTCP